VGLLLLMATSREPDFLPGLNGPKLKLYCALIIRKFNKVGLDVLGFFFNFVGIWGVGG